MDDLRLFIKELFGENISTIHLKSWKFERDWIEYTTKGDAEPYHNLKTSKFIFNYKMYHWAKSIRHFSATHPLKTFINI